MIKLELFGVVGEDFNAASVSAALREGGDVNVVINSGGGYASEGAAIHSQLVAHKGKVMVDIIGIAASAASLLAMAGDTITMHDGAVLMIHDPMNITIGNSADHAKTIEELEVIAKAYAAIYGKRAGITEKAARAIMRAETWYDGDAAVKAGFATKTSSKPATAWASFDYNKYAKPMAGASAVKAGWRKAFMNMQAHDRAFVIRG